MATQLMMLKLWSCQQNTAMEMSTGAAIGCQNWMIFSQEISHDRLPVHQICSTYSNNRKFCPIAFRVAPFQTPFPTDGDQPRELTGGPIAACTHRREGICYKSRRGLNMFRGVFKGEGSGRTDKGARVTCLNIFYLSNVNESPLSCLTRWHWIRV